jgi:hypothetical protein
MARCILNAWVSDAVLLDIDKKAAILAMLSVLRHFCFARALDFSCDRHEAQEHSMIKWRVHPLDACAVIFLFLPSLSPISIAGVAS